MADCKQEVFEFQGHFGRKITTDFNGGHLSSDGGLLFIREVANKREIMGKALAGHSTLNRLEEPSRSGPN